MLRVNVVLQELRVNAEGECRANAILQELRVNAVLQEQRANDEGKFYSARAKGEC